MSKIHFGFLALTVVLAINVDARYVYVPHVQFKPHIVGTPSKGGWHPSKTMNRRRICVAHCDRYSFSVVIDAGDICVSNDAAVGQYIDKHDGRLMTIQALQGLSIECTSSGFPVLATVSESKINARMTTARLDIPEGWAEQPLTDKMKLRGVTLYVTNRAAHMGFELSTERRDRVDDIDAWVQSRAVAQLGKLQDAQMSSIEHLDVNGVRAWRHTTTGRLKTGTRITYMNTVLEGENEDIVLSAWALADDFETEQAVLTQISNSVTGISDTPADEQSDSQLQTTTPPE